MNQQPEAAQRALALEATDEVVRQSHALGGRAEHELARMQNERLLVTALDEFGQFFEVLLDVDDGHGVVAEHAEIRVEVKVDRRWLHARVDVRIDDDAPGCDLFANAVIGEDHRRRTLVFPALPGVFPLYRADFRPVRSSA